MDWHYSTWTYWNRWVKWNRLGSHLKNNGSYLTLDPKGPDRSEWGREAKWKASGTPSMNHEGDVGWLGDGAGNGEWAGQMRKMWERQGVQFGRVSRSANIAHTGPITTALLLSSTLPLLWIFSVFIFVYLIVIFDLMMGCHGRPTSGHHQVLPLIGVACFLLH